MAYKKYNSSNNAFAAFNLPIADTDVTCVLKGKYSRFPTSNFIMKATHVENGVVTGRENIYVATRTGATCTGLVRAYEPVPVDDDATTNIQQALNFSADDIVEVVVSSKFLKDMQEEIDAKLAKVGEYRTGLIPNGAITTDGLGNEQVTFGAGFVPTGGIMPFAGASSPSGFLLCDGSAVSRTIYSALFSIVSTTYGIGDGSTTFNLPNLKGRVPVGKDSGQSEFDVLGEIGGAKTHTLTISEIPSHNHTGTYKNVGNSANSGPAGGAGGSDQTSNVSAQGGGAAHNNLQPYLVINYIIKA